MEEQRLITDRYKQLQKQIKALAKHQSAAEQKKLEKAMADFYYLHAKYHFVIAYYNFYERYMAEEEGMLTEQAALLANELFPLIHTYRAASKQDVHEESQAEKAGQESMEYQGTKAKNKNTTLTEEQIKEKTEKVNAIRSSMIRHMECIGAYTDRFTLFEYILNRLEKNYETDTDGFAKDAGSFDNQAAAKEIVQAIFSNQDNNAVNMKLQMMLAQLPVRITKAKYYQIMEESLNLYEGAELSSVEKFIYMMRSAAGLYRPDQMEKLYPQLEKWALILTETEFRKLTKDEYYEKCKILEEASDFLNQSSECYMDLQEMINHFYVMNLLQNEVDSEIAEQGRLLDSIFDFVDVSILNNDEILVPEELLEEFEQLEGVLEQINEAVELSGTYIVDIIENRPEDDTADEQGTAGPSSNALDNSEEGLMDDKFINCLDTCRKLISSSAFVQLEEEDEIELADKEYLQNRLESLKSEFEELFIRNNAKVNRAVMASVLKEFPTFFSSGKEVMSYVQYSLENCKDMSEKKVSYTLLMDSLSSFE